MKKIIAIILGLSISNISLATYIQAANTTITQVSSYGSGSVTGDVIIKIASPVTSCEQGYYISASNFGKQEILSIALSAFHSGATVTINAYDTPRWAGSSGNLCLIEGIHLKK